MGRRRWTVNITGVERIARVLVGAVTSITGIVLLTGAGSPLAVALVIALIVAGADLIVTGAVGHCPLYRALGHVPRSLRSRS